MENNKINCTVAILTFNSEATIKATLESVKNFREIIICDGGSTDETLALARAYGAKILAQDSKFKNKENKIIDFSGVRNQSLQASTNSWFFYLDSDELMTPSLEAEISSIISDGHPSATFWVPRKYTLEGEIVDCAATYPTKQMRFFHRDAVLNFIKTIHERIEIRSGVAILALKNFMLVPMNPDPMFHRKKWNHYIELEAARCGRISFRYWVLSCLENLKISLLYLYRYVRNFFLCRRKHMPWNLERERHVYHIHMGQRFWRLIEKF